MAIAIANGFQNAHPDDDGVLAFETRLTQHRCETPDGSLDMRIQCHSQKMAMTYPSEFS
jgi:hypothetical protein